MHPATFYFVFILLPQFLIAAFLAFRPRWRWTNYAFFSCIAYLSLYALSNPNLKSGDQHLDSLLGSALGGSFFSAMHLLLLVDPIMDHRHSTDVDMISPMELPWWKRIYWVLCAIFAMRGIGWDFQAPYITIQRHRNRVTFVLFALTHILGFFLLADAARYLSYILDTKPMSPQSSRLKTTLYHLETQVGRTIASGMQDYASLSQMYYLVAIASVVLGLSSQDDWPPLFGSWTEAYCLRNFWGRTWHQMTRRFCISPGRFLTRILKIQPNWVTSKYIKLYVAFLVSAVTHSFGDYRANRLGRSLLFFMLQPLAITVEEGIRFYHRKARQYHTDNLNNSTIISVWQWRIVGYIWVMLWFTFTTPLLLLRPEEESESVILRWLVEKISSN